MSSEHAGIDRWAMGWPQSPSSVATTGATASGYITAAVSARSHFVDRREIPPARAHSLAARYRQAGGSDAQTDGAWARIPGRGMMATPSFFINGRSLIELLGAQQLRQERV